MTYANGTPSWIDLGSPDNDASAAFYGELLELDDRLHSDA